MIRNILHLPPLLSIRRQEAAALSYSLWQRRFGGDESILGQSLRLGGNTYTVVGILPQNFLFAPAGAAQLWVTLNPGRGEVSARAQIRIVIGHLSLVTGHTNDK